MRYESNLPEKVAPILEYFGGEAQELKTIEELAECLAALSKHMTTRSWTPAARSASRSAVIQEVADCLIMLHQMRLHLGQADVDEQIQYKINRTMELIERRKELIK
jgi:hypothetical protein